MDMVPIRCRPASPIQADDAAIFFVKLSRLTAKCWAPMRAISLGAQGGPFGTSIGASGLTRCILLHALRSQGTSNKSSDPTRRTTHPPNFIELVELSGQGHDRGRLGTTRLIGPPVDLLRRPADQAAPPPTRSAPRLGAPSGSVLSTPPRMRTISEKSGTAQSPCREKNSGQASFFNSRIITLRSVTRNLRRRFGRCQNQAPRHRCA